MIKWLSGRKTYIVAVIVGVLASLNYLGVLVPEWVYTLLAALGLGAVRAAIGKVKR